MQRSVLRTDLLFIATTCGAAVCYGARSMTRIGIRKLN
jgi:hypothetical protein